jgi:hypothetical protein
MADALQVRPAYRSAFSCQLQSSDVQRGCLILRGLISAIRSAASNVLGRLRLRRRGFNTRPDAATAVKELLAAKSLAQMRDIIRAHPLLLSPQTDAYLQQETAHLTTPALRDTVDRILWTLKRCREKGIDAYFAELQPIADLLEHFADKARAPKDLNMTPPEDPEQAAETSNTLAALSVAAYRGEDYPYAGGQAEQIKAAGQDEYLVSLATRITTDTDWAEAARKIENIQRAQARKYIAELAKRHPDSPVMSRIGFEFIKCKTPNAFAYHVAADESFAIGLDPGLQSLFALLFHASRVAVYHGIEDFFVDLLTDLVKSHFLGRRIDGLENRILSLDKLTGQFDRHWADWAGYVAVHFLVGHEVAHIQLGHFQRTQAPRIRMAPDRDSEAEFTAFDHQFEFEADEWSAKELIQLSDTLSSRIGACTMPAIFMSVMAMVEDLYLPTDPVGKIQRENHPPAWERAQRLSKIGIDFVRDPLKTEIADNPSKLPGDIRRLYELPKLIENIRSSREFRETATMTRSLARELERAKLPKENAPGAVRYDAQSRIQLAHEAAVRGLTAMDGLLKSSQPPICTLSMSAINRQARPSSLPVDAANLKSNFFAFTCAWGDILAGCLLEVHIDALLDKFIDFCFCEVVLGTAAYLDRRPEPSSQIEQLSDPLATLFEAYAFAREYAHIGLDHIPISESQLRDEDELAADALAFKAMLHAFADSEFSYFSVAGYFCAIQLIERGAELLKGNPSAVPSDGSYLPAMRRRVALFNLAKTLISNEAMQAAAVNLKRIEHLTHRMWEPMESAFWNRAWHTSYNVPGDWVPRDDNDKSLALFAFKNFCLSVARQSGLNSR